MLFRVASIRAAETRLQQGLAPAELMGRAAAAVADEAGRWLRCLAPRAEVALLVGPGNNGGDALLAGLILEQRGYRVRAWGVDALIDGQPRAVDAALARERWQPRPIAPLSSFAATFEAVGISDAEGSRHSGDAKAPRQGARRDPLADLLVIDGLFGIGLTRPLGPPFPALFTSLQGLRQRGCRLIAIDVPSGLDADTGALPDSAALPESGGSRDRSTGPSGTRADATAALQGGHGALAAAPAHGVLAVDATVTMIGDKPGLRTGLGREVSGRIRVAALQAGAVHHGPSAGEDELPPSDDDLPPPDGHLIDEAAARRWLPLRAIDSHKGRHGDLLIIGGRDGMQGAARLAARGAIGAGAGKVSIAMASAAECAAGPADPTRPETMSWPWRKDGLGRFDVVIAGCGLGFAPLARRWLAPALDHGGGLVLDADALTWLARDAVLARRLARRPAGATVMTPHPLEAARLLGCDAAAVQRDRIGAALRLARRTGTVVVLKGSGTIVADPRGHWAINDSGGPVLATAGTGDVLAGIVGALAAQVPLAHAACLGVWLHGAAGDDQARTSGSIGTPAAVFAEVLPRIWSALQAGDDAANERRPGTPTALTDPYPRRRDPT